MKKNYQMKYQKVFICDDCIFIFRLHTPTSRSKPFCPECGNFNTSLYNSDKHTKKERIVIPWTEEELEILAKCMYNELSPHQVAIMLGRSIGSVRKRLDRMKEGN